MLNTLDTLSLLSSAITVYCGIFFIADSSLGNGSQCNIVHSFILLALYSHSGRYLKDHTVQLHLDKSLALRHYLGLFILVRIEEDL